MVAGICLIISMGALMKKSLKLEATSAGSSVIKPLFCMHMFFKFLSLLDNSEIIFQTALPGLAEVFILF